MAGWSWGTGHAVAEIEAENRRLKTEVERLRAEARDNSVAHQAWAKGMTQEVDRLQAQLQEVVEAVRNFREALDDRRTFGQDREDLMRDVANAENRLDAALAVAQSKEGK